MITKKVCMAQLTQKMHYFNWLIFKWFEKALRKIVKCHLPHLCTRLHRYIKWTSRSIFTPSKSIFRERVQHLIIIETNNFLGPLNIWKYTSFFTTPLMYMKGFEHLAAVKRKTSVRGIRKQYAISIQSRKKITYVLFY